MKKSTVILIFIVSHAALFVVGFYIGKIISFDESMKKANTVGTLAAAGIAGEYLRSRLETGDCSEAKEALLTFDRALEDFNKQQGSRVQNIYFFDRVLTYTRLAKIVRKQGDESKVAQYLSLAQKTCAAGNWRDCSEKSLYDIAATLDRKITIKCLSQSG